MTVGELRAAIAALPDDAEIVMDADGGENALLSVFQDHDGTVRFEDDSAHNSRTLVYNEPLLKSDKPAAEVIAEMLDASRNQMAEVFLSRSPIYDRLR